MAKRLTFTNANPNDKGFFVPNNVIRWDRFKKNPVALKNHKWDDDPIGFWTAIKTDADGSMSGIPVLHEITDTATKTKALYNAGQIRAASIGGIADFKKDPSGRRDKDGNPMLYVNPEGYLECIEFDLYEISIVTLPSNEDAVTEESGGGHNIFLSAHCYTRDEISAIEGNIVTLSSKYNLKPMTPEEIQAQADAAAAAALAAKPDPAKPGSVSPTVLAAAHPANPSGFMSAEQLPGVIKSIMDGLSSALKALGIVKNNATIATPTDLPETHPASDAPLHVPQPGPIGMKGAAEKAVMESAVLAAEKAIAAAQALQTNALAANAPDTLRAEYATALESVKSTMAAAELAAKNYAVALESDDDSEDEEMSGGKKKKMNADGTPVKASAVPGALPAKPPTPSKPMKKTLAQLQAEQVTLAAPPSHSSIRIGSGAQGKTFTELRADKGEGRTVLNRVMTPFAQGKQIGDYQAVLDSLINDGRYAAIVDKMRVMMDVNESDLQGLRQNAGARVGGLSLGDISQQLASGQITMMQRGGGTKKITQLTSTDNALAAPALNTIEWLPLAIFKLFPSTSWKNQIPLFSAEVTGKNTGVIWANIAADPTIYKGNQPVNPANYTYGDTPVAMSLTPYWLQPMLWTPLTMHQLRYDQMATGWAQAFAKWNSVMDDNLLYTLGSTVPASSILYSTGMSGYQANAQTFYVNGVNNVNKFAYNPAFVGQLNNPVLNDILTLEQIYNTQDFPLEELNNILVMDPIMDRYLKGDPETKSLLTREITYDGAELTKYSHTTLIKRSRILAFDPATGQVKDPGGVIPATTLSAGYSFIPSQVALGLGMLDVFMVQDPNNYGYKMSADIRIGAASLRADFSGQSILTYGAANI